MNLIVKIKILDLKKLLKINNKYKIKLLNINGSLKIKFLIRKNKYLILLSIIFILFLRLLSNMILDIKVLHNNKEIRQIILKELKNNNIEKYKFKKDYKKLIKIKNNIKDKYKDKIDWLEIEEHGTKYIVRVEERIITKEKQNNKIRDIVAKKDALLLKIDAKKGIVVKEKNNYVKKGETIISSKMQINDEISTIEADGQIYGEVWYKSKIEYPLSFIEKKKTGKEKTTFILKFLNKEIGFKKYKEYFKRNKIMYKNNILPISIIKQKQIEIKKYKHNYSIKEAVKKAENKLIKQINASLKEKEYIIGTKKLKVSKNNSKIVLELFVSVYENITDYRS